MPPKKADTPFQADHELKYAMQVVSRASNGDATVQCKFCNFFDKHVKVANTMHRYIDLDKDTLTYKIKASIVDTIIGDLFFRDDEVVNDYDDADSDDGDVVGAAKKQILKKIREKKHAMQLFIKPQDEEESGIEDEEMYTVTIKNTMRYGMALDNVATGISFSQVAKANENAKNRNKMAKLVGLNDLMVGQYVRVSVAAALQTIADMLDDESVWAFSLAGDGSTHRGQSFFDLHTRICFRGELINLHLVAIPMFHRHTAGNIFDMLVKFLDALYSSWRAKLIGMSSDGENTMTGRHSGLVTRMVRCAENPVLRIWCAPHQMDLVAKSSADDIDDGLWIKFAYELTVYLRAQLNLIIEMGVKCPKKTQRWVHLGNVLKFIKEYRRRLLTYIKDKRPDMDPTNSWWIITYAVSPAIDHINITFASLQSRLLLIAQQQEFINLLIATLVTMFSVEFNEAIPAIDEQEDAVNVEYVSVDSMRIPVDAIVDHIEEQGSFPTSCYEELGEDEKKAVVTEIAMYAMRLITGLMGVKAERDDNNHVLDDDAPPVMPAQLVEMRHSVLNRNVLNKCRAHVSKFWPPEAVGRIEQDHRDLIAHYRSDSVFKAKIETHDVKTLFNDAWDCAPNQFVRLRMFCGGLATVFANTTSVESDFSILKWEMDEFRTCLMHLSLEGIF